MKDFLLCFIPLFVAVDAIGVLPIYLGLTEGLSSTQRRHIIIQSIVRIPLQLTSHSGILLTIYSGFAYQQFRFLLTSCSGIFNNANQRRVESERSDVD